MRARLLTLTTVAVAAGALGAGCGNSPAPPAGSPTPVAGAATTAASDPAATQSQTAQPVTRRVDPRRNGLEIAMGEWAVQLEANVIRPGAVTFVLSNRGTVGHGFEIEVDEDSSGHGGDSDRHKFETNVIAPGQTMRFRLNLPPGIYKVECLVDGHDDLGMETILEVRRGAPLVVKERAANRTNAVAIEGFAFRPAKLAVRAGQAVTWTNSDPAPHTVTQQGGGFSSKTLDQGARFRMVFDRPGTYRYVCALHPEMRGTVVVRR